MKDNACGFLVSSFLLGRGQLFGFLLLFTFSVSSSDSLSFLSLSSLIFAE